VHSELQVAGIVAGLIEKLARAGMGWIEQRPAGLEGTEYVFRKEKM
jgi:hypothetical protein